MCKSIHVFILTFCRNVDLFYGTKLIFQTLRVGFPNADITVIDNSSIPEARSEIKFLAKQTGCNFNQLSYPGIKHHKFIETTIREISNGKVADGPLVFLDTDICFWESCEEFSFKGLIAGRCFGSFKDEVTQTFTVPRIHTSFLWIQDYKKLQDEIRKMQIRRFDFDPFRPFSFRLENTWYRYDTGASIFTAMPDRVSQFRENHLNCYDHIFCGSHFDLLFPFYHKKHRELMSRIHDLAKKEDLQGLKGIWKYQEKVWGGSQEIKQ